MVSSPCIILLKIGLKTSFLSCVSINNGATWIHSAVARYLIKQNGVDVLHRRDFIHSPKSNLRLSDLKAFRPSELPKIFWLCVSLQQQSTIHMTRWSQVAASLPLVRTRLCRCRSTGMKSTSESMRATNLQNSNTPQLLKLKNSGNSEIQISKTP